MHIALLLVRPVGLVLALIFSTFVTLQPAQAAPVAGTLTASVAAPMVKEQVVLTGTLPPTRSRPITLMRRQGTGPWTNVPAANSNATGGFTYTVTMPASVNITVVYRVLARRITIAGTSYPEIQTPDVTLRTTPQTASLTAPASVALGSQYRLDALFTPPRAGRVVVFQRRQGTAWINVSQTTQAADGSAFATVNATALGPITYRALTKKSGGAPQVTSGTRVVTIGPAVNDTTPPPIPDLFVATGGDGSVDLTWEQVLATDLAAYQIRRAPGPTGPWTIAGEPGPGATAFTVNDLDNGTEYWFQISSFDFSGNESAGSSIVSARPTDPSPPPPVNLLSATPGDEVVDLVWDPSPALDLVGYRVYVADHEAGPYTLMVEAISPTNYTFPGLANGQTYWFRVTALDHDGHESNPSQALAAIPRDTTPPGVPMWLTATSGDTEATLGWDPVAASDIVGYRVYSGSTAAGPWNLETLVNATHTDFVATHLTNGVAYWWAVTSVDNDGNESAFSDPATTTPVDGTPPPVPTGVATESRYDGVRVTWDAVIDAGLAGYQVVRGPSATGPWAPLNVDLITDMAYLDETAVEGQTYWYAVRSRDVADNHSAESDSDEGSLSTPVDDSKLGVGAGHTCQIRAGGTLWCWGVNQQGQLGDGTAINRTRPTQIGTDSNWESVSASIRHTCGIRTDHGLWCWGANSYRQLGDGTTTPRSTPTRVGSSNDWAMVSTSNEFTCGLRVDGTLWCWGMVNGSGPDDLPIQVGTAADWTTISTGWTSSCGLKSDGSLWCWGLNYVGQLGDGTTNWRTLPVQIGSSGWVDVDVQQDFACGVQKTHTAWCWGNNDSGQLGDGTMTSRQVPTQVGAADWMDIAVGWLNHSCGIKTDGSAWCWGGNIYGETGDGTQDQSTTPQRVDGFSDARLVALGGRTSCGLTTHEELWCWGSNGTGQLGTGQEGTEPNPLQVGPDADWTAIGGGPMHSCGLRESGDLWCWGGNAQGQSGAGGNQFIAPRLIASGFAQVSTGDSHTCGVKSTGTLWCWGEGEYYRLGDGSNVPRDNPVQIGSLTSWRQVSAGSKSTCATRTDSTLWCWGYGSSGTVGDGANFGRPTPVQVGSLATWRDVSVGGQVACATQSNGSAWCWGNGMYGSLGNGDTANQNTPTPIADPNALDWLEVQSSGLHTCGIKSDTSLWCWGWNFYGQLGDGTTIDKFTPQQVAPGTGWTSVSVDGIHTCATHADHSAWCWGNNEYGSLGDGSKVDRHIPTQVGTDTDWAITESGYWHNCGLKLDGSAWCWGMNYSGQTGTPLFSLSPVRVPD